MKILLLLACCVAVVLAQTTTQSQDKTFKDMKEWSADIKKRLEALKTLAVSADTDDWYTNNVKAASRAHQDVAKELMRQWGAQLEAPT